MLMNFPSSFNGLTARDSDFKGVFIGCYLLGESDDQISIWRTSTALNLKPWTEDKGSSATCASKASSLSPSFQFVAVERRED